MVESYIQQLVDYLKKNLAKGYTLESLKWALISQDYSRSEVSRAIKLTNEELAKKAPKIKEKPTIKVEREPILQELEEERKKILEKAKEKIRGLLKNLKEIFRS
jgi:type III secretory pathway component EscU